MVEGHRTYEADMYRTVEEVAKAAGADGGLFPQSGQLAEQAAGDYSRAEEQQLKQGQAIRGDAPGPNADYIGNTHQELFDMVNLDLDTQSADARGEVANDMGNWLRDVHDQAVKATQTESASWQGPAAAQAHGFVNSTAAWADGAANASWLASNRYSQQAAAAQGAKNAMPPPSNFDQAAEMNKARQQIESGDLGGFVQTQVGISEKQASAQQAHEQAAQVLHTMDSTYHDTAATQPSFAPPPSVSGGTSVSGFNAPPSGPGGSGPYSGGGPVSGPGGGPTGGPVSGGYVPPGLSGPGPSSGSGQFPGQYPGNYQGGAPGNVPRSGFSGTSIAGALGGGPTGSAGGGDITRNPSGRGGAPRTNFAGGRVSGGGYMPKDGAGGRLGEEGKTAGKGSGSGSVGAKEGAIGRGGATASGKAGAGGAPGAGAGGGKGKEEDEGHKRKYGETEDHFNMKLTEGPGGEKVVPPVIGG
jgi:hypothetical protein